jgi:hypothetical protein
MNANGVEALSAESAVLHNVDRRAALASNAKASHGFAMAGVPNDGALIEGGDGADGDSGLHGKASLATN